MISLKFISFCKLKIELLVQGRVFFDVTICKGYDRDNALSILKLV